jgi:hypothetical protein
LAEQGGQGGDFNPGQSAAGYLASQPFTPEAGAVPEALVMLTIRGRTTAVTEIFLAKVPAGDGWPVPTASLAASLLPTHLALVEANGIAVGGNVAYLTDSADLHLLDIANPAAPKELGFYPAAGAPGVVDISNPAVSVEVSFIPAAQAWDSVVDVATAPIPGGVNVYLANRFEGLLVYADAQ